MKTIYVLDTSVLIDDPLAYKHYTDSIVIIPIAVIGELDKLKKQFGEVGKNARVAIKMLDEMSQKKDISKGIKISNNIIVKIDSQYDDPKNFQGFGDQGYGDTHILMCLYRHHLKNPKDVVMLVSNDFNLRLKAKGRGIEACDHKASRLALSDLFSGIQEVKNEGLSSLLIKDGNLDPKKLNVKLEPNECVFFPDNSKEGGVYGRKVAEDKIKPIKKFYPWGLSPRNKEQTFAIDLMMDKNVDLITLAGNAGTGKSLCALASALELVVNRREYEKIIIYRPMQEVGEPIGFLPGLLEEKLEPWFSSTFDSFELLLNSKDGSSWKRKLELLQKKGQVELAAMTYVRGRSIPNSIILIEESQNITKNDIKTLLTRAGENTKIILNGDISQVDSKNLDALNNGLTYVIDKFKNSYLAGHITFSQGERSRLATLAADVL